MRKTTSVSDLRIKVNAMIHASSDEMVETRMALATLLESVLFETENYHGYQFMRSEWDANGTGLRENHDTSRRVYL